jgi:hypothetical protein
MERAGTSRCAGNWPWVVRTAFTRDVLFLRPRGAVWNAHNQDNGQRTWRASKTSSAQPGAGALMRIRGEPLRYVSVY